MGEAGRAGRRVLANRWRRADTRGVLAGPPRAGAVRVWDPPGAVVDNAAVGALATLKLPSGDVVEVRRATVEDVPAIVALLEADLLGRAREADRDAADLAPYHRAFDAVDADRSQLLVVATAGTGVVATLQLSIIPGLSRRGALRGQIEAVRVRDSHRGRGLGAALFDWVMAEARRRGCTLVQLTTDKRRTDAHRFYARLGFVASHDGLKREL